MSQIVIIGTVFDIQETEAMLVSNPPIDNIIVDLAKNNTYESEIYYFDIKNNDNAFITVYARAEVLSLENWQQNFTINWNERSVWLPPNATFRFIPSLIFEVSLAFNYSIHFIFEATREINGQTILYASKGHTTIFSLLTIEDGHTITVRTTDQANVQRLSQIDIKYGGNYSRGFNWQTVRTMKKSYYTSIFQPGWYEILAKDAQTGVAVQKLFYLTDNKEINIVFDIIKFSSIIINEPDKIDDPLWFFFEIENNYLEIEKIDVIFRITSHDNKLQQIRQTIPLFYKGLTDGNLSFNLDWSSGEYFFEGKIFVQEELYSEINKTIVMNFGIVDEIVRHPFTPFFLFILTFVSGIISTISFIAFRRTETYQIWKRTPRNTYNDLVKKYDDYLLKRREEKQLRIEERQQKREEKKNKGKLSTRLKGKLQQFIPVEIRRKEKDQENEDET